MAKRLIHNDPLATGGLTLRRRGPVRRRSKTLAEITDGRIVDAPWPPRVLDGKMTKKQRDLISKNLPKPVTSLMRKKDRQAKIDFLKIAWSEPDKVKSMERA